MAQNRLYSRIANTLAGEIASRAYKVGDRLPPERELAVRFNVSRPTVREAIIALEIEGLVDVVMGAGVYVRSHEKRHGLAVPADVGPFELLEARAIFEGEGAAMAAREITSEEVAKLEDLLSKMSSSNESDLVRSEEYDREFHL
ncbi:MAG: GntR family transcriptional regulator, partial [Parvularcula sp.]|nr:GntR family transcriptional regulator [Parvularcula sp.]